MSILIGFIQVITFLFAIIVAFFIPGKVALGKKSLPQGLPSIIASIVVGMVLLGVQGWIFGYLQIRWASYLYLLALVCIFIIGKGYGVLDDMREIKKMKVDYLALGISFVGVIAQNINYFRIGWMTNVGMLLDSFNVGDHIWHAALTNELTQRFPPYEPGMYGIWVKNYHFWFNLVTAEVIRIFHLPLFPTQFMGMYVIGSILLGFCAYLLVTAIYPSKMFLRFVLFFLYMGGDAMGWLTLYTRHIFLFAGQRIEDATIFMDNPPRAFSFLVVLVGTYILFFSLKKPTIRLMVLMALLFGTAIGFKVYTGIAFLLGLGILIAYKIIFQRKFSLAFMGILAVGVAAAIFIPVNADSGGLFLVPFELPRDFVAQPQIGLHDWELRWRIYYAHNNVKRLIEYGTFMTIAYLFAQWGIRVIGLFPWKKMRIVLGAEKAIFLYSTTAAALVLGNFFYQHAGTANIFNFYIAAGFPLTFLTGLSITLFLEKRALWIKIFVAFLVVGFVIPRFVFANYINISGEFLQMPPYIGTAELASYAFLQKIPETSMVLVIHPMDRYDFDRDTPLVSLLTNRRMYLSGNGISDSHGNLDMFRVNTVKLIENSSDPMLVSRLLHAQGIRYLYFYGTYSLVAHMKTLPVKEVFHNNVSTILQVF